MIVCITPPSTLTLPFDQMSDLSIDFPHQLVSVVMGGGWCYAGIYHDWSLDNLNIPSRLVSAYQDKLVDSKYKPDNFDYAEYITETFGQLSFSTFVQMLLAKKKKLCLKKKGRCLLDRHWRSDFST